MKRNTLYLFVSRTFAFYGKVYHGLMTLSSSMIQIWQAIFHISIISIIYTYSHPLLHGQLISNQFKKGRSI